LIVARLPSKIGDHTALLASHPQARSRWIMSPTHRSRYRGLLVIWMLGVVLPAAPLWPCTTAVISGRATPDGRPLLWKNRDFWQPHNEVVYFRGQRFDFVAVVNAGATQNVYLGVNSAGFCLENSVSKDLSGEPGDGPGNGALIKHALEHCATVDEFESLLQRTNAAGRRTRANFGAIDAQGGAAMFEAGPTSYTRFDANDPRVAPLGFIVRSNFSATGQGLDLSAMEQAGEFQRLDGVESARRYQRGYALCRAAVEHKRLDVRYLLRQVVRDMADRLEQPLPGNVDGGPQAPLAQAADIDHTLCRRTTVSAAVFQGVLPGEDPALTTMWVLLGQPAFSIAVPCWPAAHVVAPQLGSPEGSRLCTLSLELYGARFDTAAQRLLTADLPRLWQQTFELEDTLLQQTAQRLALWRTNPPKAEELARWHRTACRLATERLAQLHADSELTVALRQQESGRDKSDGIHLDFRFEEQNGTRLAETRDQAGKATWDGGLSGCSVQDGSFRIRRHGDMPVNRYVPLQPSVGTGTSSGAVRRAPRGWIVIEVAGWDLRGRAVNEEIRFGFTSQPENSYQTAGLVISRTAADRVSLGGEAFGQGSSNIEPVPLLPARLAEPLTLVIELDKLARNSNEGDSGGVYRLYYRLGTGKFTQIGGDGLVRRLRNGNALHLRTAGFFDDPGEYFDIDRIYYTTVSPLEAR
jgi:hypothetical protein